MREILFRGKSEKNGNWIEGSLIVSRDLESGQLEYLIAPLSAYYTEVKKVIPETVGQYTGLTDKNGTKVFEGDIVALRTGRPHEVKYNNGGFELVGTAIPIRHINNFNVIGNIRDNFELLGGEQWNANNI